MNETRLWCCDICDKTITFVLSLKINQNILTPILINIKFSVVVKEYEFIRPDINRRDYIIKKSARDCYSIYFHTFKFKCIYEFELTNGDFVNGIISDKKFKKLFEKMVFT